MLIDDFLPDFDVRERHQTLVHAPLAQVYDAVRRLDIGGARLTMMLFSLRGLFFGRHAPGFSLDDFLRLGFVPLGERPNEELLLGLVGRFWTPTGDLQRLDAERFRAFREPGYAKAAWNFTLSERHTGVVCLATETRVHCLDDACRGRFKAYWALIGPFSGLIRRDVLSTIKRGVEHGDG